MKADTGLRSGEKPLPPRRAHYLTLALLWSTFTVYGSLVPLNYRPVEWAAAVEQFRSLPPLWVGLGTRADWVANILLFVPLTFLWMGALTEGRRRMLAVAWALALAAIATVAAVALEFTQIWFAGRTVSRNDIVAEAIGGTSGVLAWLGVGERATGWVRSYAAASQPLAKVEWLLQAYVLGFVTYSVMPLDLTISVSELYRKYQSGKVVLVPFTYGYDSASTAAYQFLADIVTFVPVGAWFTLALQRRSAIRSVLATGIAAGFAFALLVEVLQLLVLSRVTDVTDVFLGTAGATAGAWIVASRNQAVGAASGLAAGSRVLPWAAALVLYSGVLVAGFWFPFDVTDDPGLLRERYEGFFRLPFLSLYLGDEFNAIKQALVRTLLFAPIGAIWALVAVASRTRHAGRGLTVMGVVYAAVLAFGIEAGQILMPSKVADVTEVLLCVAGAAAAAVVARRLLVGSFPDRGGPAEQYQREARLSNRKPRP